MSCHFVEEYFSTLQQSMVGSQDWPFETGFDLRVGTPVKVCLPPSDGAAPVYAFGSVAYSERDAISWFFKVTVPVKGSLRSRVYTNVRPQEMVPVVFGKAINFDITGFKSEAKLLPSYI